MSAENRQSDFFYHTAHQDYLQGLIEWGWLGFAGWMGLFGMVIAMGIQRARVGSFYAVAILIAILSVALQAMVDFPFQVGSLQWVGIFLCGILVSPIKRK